MADEFFHQRGLAPNILKISFSSETPFEWIDDDWTPIRGYYWISEEDLQPSIMIYPEHLESRLDVFRTLAHEFDHAAWDLEGQEWRWDPPFWDRPHELRAQEAEQYCPQLLGSLQIPVGDEF